MELLIVRGAHIGVFPDIAHIANGEGLHTFFVECGYELARLFVLNILNLVLEFPELTPFRPDQLLATT